MSDKIFIDTNVFVYAYDKQNPEKQRIAQNILKKGILDSTISMSSQVLNEFFTVVTKKIQEPLSAYEAEDIIDLFSIINIVEIDFKLVKRAIYTYRQYQLSYWDSLIIAAAERAGCTQLYSEDFTDGQKYYELVVKNPFV